MFHSVSLLSQAALARGSRALPSVLYIYIRSQPLPLAAPGSEKPRYPRGTQESGLPRLLAHHHQLYTLWLWCPELWPGRRFLLPLEEVLPLLFFDFGMTNSTTSDCSAYLPLNIIIMQEHHNCPCTHTLQIPFDVFLANSKPL